MNSLSPPNEQFPNINILTDVYQLTLCDEKPTTPKAYITAEFDDSLFPSNKLFIVGQETPTNQAPNDRPDTYTNGELCYSGKFTFFTRAYIDTVSCSQKLESFCATEICRRYKYLHTYKVFYMGMNNKKAFIKCISK